MPKVFLIIFFTWALPNFLLAQTSNSRCQWVSLSHFAQGPYELDSLTLVPGTLQITDAKPHKVQGLAEIPFEYDINTNKVSLQQLEKLKENGADSILVCYKVFPLNFTKETFNRSQEAYDTGYYEQTYQDLQVNDEVVPLEKEEIFPTSNLMKSGSMTRGITMGNAQSMMVNSALNLQLDGNLTDDIEITASFSDQNVPFQPEGNTQNIQEFDRIFMEVRHEKVKLRAGDIILQEQGSEFLKYYKNVQGGQVEVNLGKPEEDKYSVTKVGGAVAKGQFHSLQLLVADGVQGPYRLTGPNNERFIIILANSEKVFLDSKLLKRGFNYDYIIDYNTGEITFNNTVTITKFSRVRVDFEYANQNYNRSILQGGHLQRFGKLELSINAYQEKDDKQNPLMFSLTDEDKLLLSQLEDGAKTGFALAPDTIAEFTNNRVLYTPRDTVINGREYQFFALATEQDSPLLSLSFTEVGFGNGNYVITNATANGRAYEWRPPVGGSPQGNFEPGRNLPTPNKRQMVTAGAKYHLGEKDHVFAEVAFSEQDHNLYSPSSGSKQTGRAFKAGYRNEGKKIGMLPGYQVFGGVDFELNEAGFRGIDRFRDIEFDRDWSLDQLPEGEEKIFNTGIGIRKNERNHFEYQISLRDRDNAVNGYQHKVILNKELGNFRLRSNAFFMDATLADRYSNWARADVDASYRTNIITPGYRYSFDRNAVMMTRTMAMTDSVVSTANNFEEHQFYLESGDSLKSSFRADFSIRDDMLPFEGELLRANLAQTANFTFKRRHKTGNVGFHLTYRNMETIVAGESLKEETVMGRADWSQSLWDKHIRSELNLSASTGRELRREFVFIQVEPGRGTHTWRDDNGDGIQDLNEFYIAINPEERNFAKFFIPTDEYVPAYHSYMQYRLNAEAPRNWEKEGGAKAVLGKFSNMTSVVINNRISDPNIAKRLLPFLTTLEDEGLLSTSSVIRSTLFYNQKSTKYGLEMNMLKSANKQLLTNGFEQRQNQELTTAYRVNLSKIFTHRLELTKGSRDNASDFLLDRNYLIDFYEIKPELAFQPKTAFRLTLNYAYKDKRNVLDGIEEGEKGTVNEIGSHIRWNQGTKSSLTAQLKSIWMEYEGQVNSPVGYEMLEALMPGQNFTWNINWIQRLSNGLQLNFTYHGRKSPEQNTMHFGRMQVTALF